MNLCPYCGADRTAHQHFCTGLALSGGTTPVNVLPASMFITCQQCHWVIVRGQEQLHVCVPLQAA